MVKWEYRVQTVNLEATNLGREVDVELRLNEAGSEGWEVFAVSGNHDHDCATLFMKRKLE